VKQACQSPHLTKIPGMKSISEPQHAIEIYTFWENISPKSSGRKGNILPYADYGKNYPDTLWIHP
jgi:hypothetical protein